VEAWLLAVWGLDALLLELGPTAPFPGGSEAALVVEQGAPRVRLTPDRPVRPRRLERSLGPPDGDHEGAPLWCGEGARDNVVVTAVEADGRVEALRIVPVPAMARGFPFTQDVLLGVPGPVPGRSTGRSYVAGQAADGAPRASHRVEAVPGVTLSCTLTSYGFVEFEVLTAPTADLSALPISVVCPLEVWAYRVTLDPAHQGSVAPDVIRLRPPEEVSAARVCGQVAATSPGPTAGPGSTTR
jgi:hypothetical protein